MVKKVYLGLAEQKFKEKKEMMAKVKKKALEKEKKSELKLPAIGRGAMPPLKQPRKVLDYMGRERTG